MEHIEYNDFDIAAIRHMADDFKLDNISVDFNLSQKELGIASVIMQSWRKRDGSLVIFEIHKFCKKRFIFKSIYWVIQLYSMQDQHSERVRHGCVYAQIQMSALQKAVMDVQHNFVSVLDLETACS